MSSDIIFPCDLCGQVFYAKMDVKLHKNPYLDVIECPKVEKKKWIKKPYAPAPPVLFCNPITGKGIVKNKSTKEYRKEVDVFNKIINSTYN